MIIGLAGPKGSGKDTVGAYLVKGHGFERKAFADPLKQSVAALLGIEFSEVDQLKNNPNAQIHLVTNEYSDDHPHIIGRMIQTEQTFREFLQRYGTESHRDVFGQDFWLDYTLPVQGYYPGRAIVVTDVRFENEANRIRHLGGVVWQIDRGEVLDYSHISEAFDFDIDFTIRNNGTVEQLYEMVEEALNKSVAAV